MNSSKIVQAINNELRQTSQIIKDIRNNVSSKINTPESLAFYDLWTRCDDRYGMDYPGRIPGQIIENLLWLGKI